jgi:hypothetical protein
VLYDSTIEAFESSSMRTCHRELPPTTLDSEMTADLNSLFVRVAPEREMSMAELLAGWAAHVGRLKREAVAESGDDLDQWGAHDLLAALSLRDLIASGSRSADPETIVEIEGRARAADLDFFALTRADERGVVRRFADRRAAEGWWWARIPAGGPVRDELERWLRLAAGP